jgi:hypothetical protein
LFGWRKRVQAYLTAFPTGVGAAKPADLPLFGEKAPSFIPAYKVLPPTLSDETTV